MYSSVTFAQANSRIYYSTFFGNRYTFDYEDTIGENPVSFDTVIFTTHHSNIRVETTGVSRKKFLRFVQLKQKEIKAKALEKELKNK